MEKQMLELGGGLIKPKLPTPKSMVVITTDLWDLPLSEDQHKILLDGAGYLSGLTLTGEQIEKVAVPGMTPAVVCAPEGERNFIAVPLPLAEVEWIETELSCEGENHRAIFVFGYMLESELDGLSEFDGW